MGLVQETIPVAGMDCPDCARSIERGVGALPGVRAASVSFTAGQLAVEYDAEALDQQQIVGRVRELGYSAAPPADRAAADQPVNRFAWLAEPRAVATAEAVMALVVGIILDFGGYHVPAVAAFATAMGIGGYRVARSGFQALRVSRTLDMNALMTIAALGAAAMGDWTEAATVVVLFALGNALESFTVDRARSAIRELMALAPAEARVRRGGHEITVPVEQVMIGDVVRVRPGERVPVDGRVVDGTSTVDEAPITGESTPIDKAAGDELFAGTVNGGGYLEVEASRLYSDSTIARIIRLVEESQVERAPSQRLVDRFASRYTPAVIGLAALIALVPPLALGQPFESWLYRALVLLVIACPCALVISTPVAIVAAITRAARDGILIKGGAHLETLGAVRALAIDKTGTLTLGRPAVVGVTAIDEPEGTPSRDRELLALAASAEVRSEHPFGRAIVRHAQHEGVGIPVASEFEALPGRGVRARVDGRPVAIGSPRWLEAEGVDLSPLSTALAEQEEAGRTVLVLTDDRRPIGLIALADQVRPGAAEAVAALRRAGIAPIVMLTGDNPRAAATVARQLGIDEVRAGLLPEGKVDAVRALQADGQVVAMLGDGVNDAPALASSSVGIAMGAAGSAVAIETADVALMSDDLARVPHAIRLGRTALGTIRQNVALSLVVKALFLILAATGFAGLWLAVLADMGTSLLVTLNGMRLLRPTRCDCCARK